MKILKFKTATNKADETNNDFLNVNVFFFFFSARPAAELQSAMQEKLCELKL